MSTLGDPPEPPRPLGDEDEALTTAGIPGMEGDPSPGAEDSTEVGTELVQQESRPGRIPNHVLESVALMVINGARYEDISASTGIKPDTVKALVLGGHNQTFDGLLAAYRKKVLKATSHHQMRLLDLYEHAYRAIHRGLMAEDDRVAVDTAWKLFDRTLPQQPKEAQMQVNVGFQNVHLEHQVSNTFQALGEKFESLLSRVTNEDPHRYLRDDDGTYTIPSERPRPSDEVEVEVFSEETGDPDAD